MIFKPGDIVTVNRDDGTNYKGQITRVSTNGYWVAPLAAGLKPERVAEWRLSHGRV